MKIFYLAYFSLFDGESRFCSPAANNVCSYITDVLLRNADDEIVVINLSQHKKHLKFCRSKVSNVQKNVFVNAPCYGSGRLLSRISCFFLNRWVKKYLKRNSSPEDKIIIYHSLNTLKLEGFISQNFNSILQVEEIYCDVLNKSFKTASSEINVLNSFKKHIFVSETLQKDKRINSLKSLVFYGSYSLPAVPKFRREEKSIVYAGTFEKNKGIEFACDLMRLLPDYNLYIYGHGSKSRVRDLLTKYKDFKNVYFEGRLSENELSQKLYSYRFALSPLDPQSNFSSTTFPSKILTYLKSDLIVISSKFESVMRSPFKSCLILADYDLQSFQKAIVSSSETIEKKSSLQVREFINKLDQDFCECLFKLVHYEV